VRLRLERDDVGAPGDLESIILFSNTEPRRPIRLGDIATVRCCRSRRRSCATASSGWWRSPPRSPGLDPGGGHRRRLRAVADLPLPRGYTLHEAGSLETLQQGRDLGRALLGLALFLVLVVMAVQYESLRNPLIILLSVPFALIGVVLGLDRPTRRSPCPSGSG
jgi:multidrug efflux pump subunit AcrB